MSVSRKTINPFLFSFSFFLYHFFRPTHLSICLFLVLSSSLPLALVPSCSPPPPPHSPPLSLTSFFLCGLKNLPSLISASTFHFSFPSHRSHLFLSSFILAPPSCFPLHRFPSFPLPCPFFCSHHNMDDAFDALDQAAVAGAEGATWAMTDLPSVFPPFAPTFDAFGTSDDCDPHASIHPDDTSATCVQMHGISYVPSAPIAIPSSAAPKHELHDVIHDPVPSSPSQPSNYSIDSARSSAHSLQTPLSSSHATTPLASQHSQHSRAASTHQTTTPCLLSTSPTSIASVLPLESKPLRNRVSSRTQMKSSNLSTSPITAASLLSTMDFQDLTGTTAARSRKMTDDERKVMLHKRRLRNRASAARSREKRSRTLNDLTAEVEDLVRKSLQLAQQASLAAEEARKLRAKNFMLSKENQLLKAGLNL